MGLTPLIRAIIERKDQELPAMWNHALREFVIVLLGEAYPDPEHRKRIFTAFQQYFKILLWDYPKWRYLNKDSDVKDFLVQFSFTLPSLQGGSREEDPLHVLQAAYDYKELLPCLPPKPRKGQYNAERRQRIKEVLAPYLEEPDHMLEKRLDKWQDFTPSEIALEAAAGKHDVGLEYLRRYKNRYLMKDREARRMQDRIQGNGSTPQEKAILQELQSIGTRAECL